MHARHRSPGNGVKSNSVGIRLASGRISPEGSIRRQGMYKSEYQNFNKRGIRRCPHKPYTPRPQPPSRGDIFMQAGRLAAEYLVYQGLLPPNLLTGKLQNSNLKGQMGDIQECRVQDRESPLPHLEGRISALARLGKMNPDPSSSRRRFLDDFNPVRSRSHERGRRMGNFRGNGSDWSRENRRNGPLTEKATVSTDSVDGDDEFVGEYHGEQRVSLDVGGRVPKVINDELPLENEITDDPDSELEKFAFTDGAGSKASSSNKRRDVPLETHLELNKGLDDIRISNSGIEEVKDVIICDETMEKERAPEDLAKQPVSVEYDLSSKLGSGFLEQVPTKTHTSSETSVSSVDQGPSIEESNMFDIVLAGGSKISTEEDAVEGSSNDILTNLTHSSKNLAYDIRSLPSVLSVGEAWDLDPAIVVESEKCPMLQSFSDRSFMHEQESSQAPPGFERCKLMDELTESFVQHLGTREGTKRSRELSAVSQTDELICLQDLRAKQACLQVEKISSDEEMVKANNKVRLVEGDLSPKGRTDFGLEPREEKQHMPCYFKICDLNLADASEITESPEGLVQDQISTGASALGLEKQALADVGLSICNSNFNSTHSNGGCTNDPKIVAGIDVANGSVIEDKMLCTSEQKSEPICSSLESLHNHTQNSVDLPDVRDGYSLGISELLGTNMSNCSSVSVDINDPPTGIALHNQEGIPCDDDPIYLSLGEIPISGMFLACGD